MYAESVEELVAAVPMKLLEAKAHAFHGMGREDIDALMLGGGRPFVVELKDPRLRTLDVAAVQAAINQHAAGKAEVLDLRPATKDDVLAVKSSTASKSYVAQCEAAQDVPAEKLLSTLPSLRGVLIRQRTPNRVSHRRADLVRTRRVLDVELTAHTGREFTLRITAEAGTYIKELVSSDDGRTQPSLAGLLGVPVVVTALDVVDVAEATPRDGEPGGLPGVVDIGADRPRDGESGGLPGIAGESRRDGESGGLSGTDDDGGAGKGETVEDVNEVE
jgi:tRNA pseudouridine synthase 10